MNDYLFFIFFLMNFENESHGIISGGNVFFHKLIMDILPLKYE